MRKSTLPLFIMATACAAEPVEYIVVEGFLDRSRAVTCELLDSPIEMAVTSLRPASDSTILVLDGPTRRVVELDQDLRELWKMEAPSVGPGALDAPISAVALGDTAVAVAERRGLRLNVYSRSRELIRSTPLQFVPHAMASGGAGDVLITAMPMGAEPASLLMRYTGNGIEGLGVPARSYADMLVSALGNSTLVEQWPDGSAVVVHQFMSPRGFMVTPGGDVRPLRVPTPDETLDAADYVPTAPFTEAELSDMLVPAIAMAVDPTRSHVYLLTRSGRRLGDRLERAVLRLDRQLNVVDTFLLDVPAVAMAFLPRKDLMLVADANDRFHACRLPHATTHALTD
jgi:hypothetical protein